MKPPGMVSIIGAGPGDPELITVKAMNRLREAEVVLYDRLVSEELLPYAGPFAELVYVGKAPGRHAMPQEEIERWLIRYAMDGKRVVRLKGGDPFVFGRGGEEALALAAAGIPYEVIPGITSALGAAASAGVPLTHRGAAASFACVTGSRCHGDQTPIRWEAAEASRQYLHLACHPITGLAPEYAYYDGTPNHERGYGHFFSDAYRVAANLGLDWEWFAADPWQREIVGKIQAFFADKKPEDYRRYTISGEPFEEPALHPVGLLATNAMASLAAYGPQAKACVELFWNTPVRTGKRRYYDNCLYLFALLALSGNYRIWMPPGAV